jgi:hypothetical protein
MDMIEISEAKLRRKLYYLYVTGRDNMEEDEVKNMIETIIQEIKDETN